MSNIKKIITRYLNRIALIVFFLTFILVSCLQLLSQQRQARERATVMLYQIEQLLVDNEEELEQIKAEYSQTCLHNAEAIAYMIEQNPTVLESTETLRQMADFMEVDEIHIFDKTGCIYAGTHPEYYGYTMDSGTQISFFKPMLENTSLTLCQDIVPNTAENKPMQYSALWSRNGEFIVQVGMEPVNVLKVTEKNELSYIFSMLRVNVGVNLYAVDGNTGEIKGSIVQEDVGRNVYDLGIELSDIINRGEGFHAKVNGEYAYCVFLKMGENYIGRIVSNKVLYSSVPVSMLGLVLSLAAVAVMLVGGVKWCMNRYVVDGIYDINNRLRAITDGNLDERVDVHTSLEFSELSCHINEMVNSLLSTTDKISYVINKTNLNIGVYEYNENMKHVRFTEYIPQILGIDGDKLQAADCKEFKEYIDKLRMTPLADEEGIYSISGEKEIYLKLEEVVQGNDVFGIVMDVTKEIIKRRRVEEERDIDTLTGLYNRRGIENKLFMLFKESDKLGYGALVMIDADGLKEINDRYGHDKGDIYLKKISEVISSFGLGSCVAARQGGDEFVLYLYNYADESELMDALVTLQYIQNNSSAHLSNELSVPLRFSYGYVMTKGENDYQQLLKIADDKMYENKRERKKKEAGQNNS